MQYVSSHSPGSHVGIHWNGHPLVCSVLKPLPQICANQINSPTKNRNQKHAPEKGIFTLQPPFYHSFQQKVAGSQTLSGHGKEGHVLVACFNPPPLSLLDLEVFTMENQLLFLSYAEKQVFGVGGTRAWVVSKEKPWVLHGWSQASHLWACVKGETPLRWSPFPG